MAQPWYLFSSLYWLKINVKTSFTFRPCNCRKKVVKVMVSTDDRQGDDIPPHCRAAAPTSLIRTLKCTSLLRARLVHVRARQDGYSFNPARLQFLSCFPSSLLVLSLTFSQTCPSPASRQRAASSALKHFLESGNEERYSIHYRSSRHISSSGRADKYTPPQWT